MRLRRLTNRLTLGIVALAVLAVGVGARLEPARTGKVLASRSAATERSSDRRPAFRAWDRRDR